MDTDSAYMALSGPLETIIRPELRTQFFEEYGKWFPRPYCPQHHEEFMRVKTASDGDHTWARRECCDKVYRYDTRTPGLFKEEWSGDAIVALNSKTYFCWNESDAKAGKCSSKGLSKTTNTLTKENFLNVLNTKQPKTGQNKGFVKKDGSLYTYSQVKTGLTYFYAKRRVCADGVSTEPIDI
jgi:hypothetical protein